MSVETEFEWKLNSGLTVTVSCSGDYLLGDYPSSQNAIMGMALGYAVEETVNYHSVLVELFTELRAIEEHAVICLCEKAREVSREAS